MLYYHPPIQYLHSELDLLPNMLTVIYISDFHLYFKLLNYASAKVHPHYLEKLL